jgi:F-type H+-transporting ATPase subunit b
MLLPSLAPLSTLLLLAEAAPPGAEEKAPPVIDLDGTVLVQFAIFIVMYLVLRRFLFQPYLRMRAEREAHIDGVEKAAKEMEHKRETLEAEYQQRMQKARSGADEERLRMQSEGRARETELLGQARSRAQAQVSEVKGKIAAQVVAAQAELEKHAEPLARSLAHKLLGREI